jgi:hypothetical protein
MKKRRTIEEFIKEVNELTNGEYKVLTEFKSVRKKVKMQHVTCNYVWGVLPDNFINKGTRCPECRKGVKKKSDILKQKKVKVKKTINKTKKEKISPHDKYITKVKVKLGNKYEVLGEYKDYKTKILVRHYCDYSWEIYPSELFRLKSCPRCSNRVRKTQEEFEEQIKALVGNEYEVIGEYKGSHKKVKMKHVECGHIWKVEATAFANNGTRCPNCNGGIKKTRTHDDFVREVNLKFGDKYEILSIYKNMSTDIAYKCKEHGELVAKPQTFLMNGCNGCCMDRRAKTHDQFLLELKGIHENITPIDTYKRSKYKMRFKCTCGHEWKITANQILTGYGGCPICDVNTSTGEKKVESYLQSMNIKYTKQYTNEKCKYVKTLRFDIYVENKILIEYDGKQHFEPIDFGGKGMEYAIEDFETRRSQDIVKNNFCIENNIPLIRIPYYENDIYYILEQILCYFNLIDKQFIDESIVSKYLVNHPDWAYEKYMKQAKKYI